MKSLEDLETTELQRELAQLDLDTHDKRLDGTPADRSIHHGPAGAAEHTRMEAIRAELRRRGEAVIS